MNGTFFPVLPLQKNQKGRMGFQERISQQDSVAAFTEHDSSHPSPARVQQEGPCQPLCHHWGCATTPGPAAGPHKHSSILCCWQELVATAHCCFPPLNCTEDALHAQGPISVLADSRVFSLSSYSLLLISQHSYVHISH